MTPLVTGSFSGGFARRRVSLGYRLGMLLVLLGLIILPLLYLMLIAGMGWLLKWHVQHDLVWIQTVSEWSHYHGKATVLAGLLYLAVAVAGVICLVFMTKPLFAPLPEQPPTVTLDPISEPALFALIYRICDLVGAPRPVMVEVDSRVNASASFRRGMASFFGHDMVLSIGMPLVAGMTARQLAGVLAHEFGHFSQGGGMRLNYLVRSINFWFARVVLDRDQWDERLQALTDREGFFGFVGLFASWMVCLGRKVLRILMQAGGAISGFFSRQMEYDADAYGAQVAGSSEMAGALVQLELLGQAEKATVENLFSKLEQRELPDNLPGRIASCQWAMSESLREKVKRKALAEESSWWSTHPALNERVEKLKDTAAKGVCHLDMPAEELFRDFTGLCKTVSLYWYDVELGMDLNKFELVAADDIGRVQMDKRQRHAQEAEEQKNMDREVAELFRKAKVREAAVNEMFGHPPPAHRLLPVPMGTPEEWAPAASIVEAWKAEYGPACEREKMQRDKLCKRTLACHMLHLGHDLTSLAVLGTDTRSAAAVMAAQAESLQEHEITSKQLAFFEQAGWTRITAALAWRFQQEHTLPSWREEVRLMVEAQRALATAMRHLMAVCVEAMLMENVSAVPMQVRHEYEARVQAEWMNGLRVLGTAADPYAPQSRPLSEALGQQAPGTTDGRFSIESYTLLKNNLCQYANRVTQDLCLLVREVEQTEEDGPWKPDFRSPILSAWQSPAMASAA